METLLFDFSKQSQQKCFVNLHSSDCFNSLQTIVVNHIEAPEKFKAEIIKESMMRSWELGYDIALSEIESKEIKEFGFSEIVISGKNFLAYELSYSAFEKLPKSF